MPFAYTVDQEFNSINFMRELFYKGDYENCIFTNCNFSYVDISSTRFSQCEFIDCNLSVAVLRNTAFKGVDFKNCKMLGLNFDSCDPFCFEVSFENCTLSYSNFYQVKLKMTTFRNSRLDKVDFGEADLSGAVFDECDLFGATFANTILEGVDFRTSFNYIINPLRNRIKKAKFSLNGVSGLLHTFDIEIEI